jgi:transcriptional regulator with XRE-family HTH domain
MPEKRAPAEMQIAIVVLRTLRGWDQSDLAEAAGLSPSSISRYEAGDTVPSPRTFARIVAAVGLSASLVERLFAWIRSARATVGGSPVSAEGVIEALCGEVSEGISHVCRSAAALILGGMPGVGEGPWGKVLPPLAEDRLRASALWGILERREPSDRRMRVEDAQEFRSWALCELVCAESVKAAADDAGRAVELAELAVLIADLAPGEETWRWRLQGYAQAHLGNARRVRTDWPGAEEAFGRADKLWQAGAPGDPGLLSEARVLSLEASLRTDQNRLPEADALLKRALAADPGVQRPSLLIKRARVREWAGDYEGALAALREVGPLPPERQEPRLLWMLRIHPAFNLCHLERYAEAEALLPEVRALTARLDNKLDGLRLRWLEARVAAGLGRAAEAEAAFSQVRAGFAGEDIAYDAALVTLELAVVYLEQGRTREVKGLARQMGPIFKAQGVHREALAALKLFCDAVEKETATAELARRIVGYLYRAQHNPELRFEAVNR